MDGFAALAIVVGTVVLGAVVVTWVLVRVVRQRHFHTKCLLEVRANDSHGASGLDSPKEVDGGQ